MAQRRLIRMASASIIICTRNRASDLEQTLASFGQVELPVGLEVDLLVVDNGSTDQTQEVVRSFRHPRIPVRAAVEARKGLSYARNRGMAETSGELILWTDDDVRVPPDWLAGMSAPLLTGAGDAVVGGVSIAAHLQRACMREGSWFGCSGEVSPGVAHDLYGANMGFLRTVLQRVPAFDEELGAGALGSGEEHLFSLQLKEAGYRIAAAAKTVVEHHFDPDRLTRPALLDAAKAQGRSTGYILYHYSHERVTLPALHLLKRTMKLLAWRLQSRRQSSSSDGALQPELDRIRDIEVVRQMRAERGRPRNYEYHGLTKQHRRSG